jgi:hypothetical protein
MHHIKCKNAAIQSISAVGWKFWRSGATFPAVGWKFSAARWKFARI